MSSLNELGWRFIAGGSLVTLISVVSKTKYSALSGVLVLFPAVTLVGYYFIGQSVDSSKMKEITIYSLYALPTTILFLLTFYFCQGRYDLINSLLISILAWTITAYIVVLVIR